MTTNAFTTAWSHVTSRLIATGLCVLGVCAIGIVLIGCIPLADSPPADDTGGSITLSGLLTTAGAARSIPQGQSAIATYDVIAQSNETGELYRGTTDGTGAFEIEIPATENGNTFIITILGSDGKAIGPVLFGTADNEGLTGIDLDRDVELGTLELPDDPTTDTITPGDDTGFADLVDGEVSTRLNDDGVPVGLDSYGKGVDAQSAGNEPNDANNADADQDGLIDVLDADDDGDGIVDDFDGDGDTGGIPSDLMIGFFTNLKISAEQATTYYDGSTEEVNAALAQDTIITFEIMTTGAATRTITSAHMIETVSYTHLRAHET